MLLDMSKVHTPDGVQAGKIYTMISVDQMGRVKIVDTDIVYVKHEDNCTIPGYIFKNRLFDFNCKENRGITGFGIYLNQPTEDVMLILQEKGELKK